MINNNFIIIRCLEKTQEGRESHCHPPMLICFTTGSNLPSIDYYWLLLLSLLIIIMINSHFLVLHSRLPKYQPILKQRLNLKMINFWKRRQNISSGEITSLLKWCTWTTFILLVSFICLFLLFLFFFLSLSFTNTLLIFLFSFILFILLIKCRHRQTQNAERLARSRPRIAEDRPGWPVYIFSPRHPFAPFYNFHADSRRSGGPRFGRRKITRFARILPE